MRGGVGWGIPVIGELLQRYPEYTTLHRIAWHWIASHCITLHRMALHSIISHCIALYRIALHCSASHCVASHCIALCLIRSGDKTCHKWSTLCYWISLLEWWCSASKVYDRDWLVVTDDLAALSSLIDAEIKWTSQQSRLIQNQLH